MSVIREHAAAAGPLQLREATADDADATRTLLCELSPRDRYFRFHSFGAVTDAKVDALLPSGSDACTVVAVDGTRLAGVASCRTRPDGTPEIAVVVHERHRHRGVGLNLLRLASAAYAGRRAVATVIVDNTAALRLVRKFDPHAKGEVEFGCLVIELRIPDAA